MEVLCEKLTELFDLLEHEVLPKPRNLTKDEEHDSLSISSFPWSMSENGLNILNTLCFTLLEFDGLGLVCTHDQSSLLRRLIQRLIIVLRETMELKVRSRLIKACFPILLKHSNISQVFEDKKEEGFEVLGVELWNLSLAFSPSDLDNSSSLLCIASKECASRCSLFARQTSFYPLLILFFKHPLAYIRRRGAFLLSSAVPINSSSISSDSSLLQNSGWKGKRHWIFDFMDCYELIENSSSLHLVKQVEPYLLHLFAINVDYTVAYSCSSSSSAYPPISFDWPSILFHCLLQAPIPSLRKYAIQLLFTNQLPLSLTPPTIEWLCYTILPAIDSTMYFPPNLVAVESVNSATFPGVLFPLFLSHHLSSTNTSEGTEHLKLFLRSFLKSLCEMSSLCAIKYLLSAFGNTTTLSSLPGSSIPVSLLHGIRNFITRKLSLTNSLVRTQV